MACFHFSSRDDESRVSSLSFGSELSTNSSLNSFTTWYMLHDLRSRADNFKSAKKLKLSITSFLLTSALYVLFMLLYMYIHKVLWRFIILTNLPRDFTFPSLTTSSIVFSQVLSGYLRFFGLTGRLLSLVGDGCAFLGVDCADFFANYRLNSSTSDLEIAAVLNFYAIFTAF